MPLPLPAHPRQHLSGEIRGETNLMIGRHGAWRGASRPSATGEKRSITITHSMEKRSITISLHVETRSIAITPTAWKSLQSPSPPGRGRGRGRGKEDAKKEEANRDETRKAGAFSQGGRRRGGVAGEGWWAAGEEGGQFLKLESFCSWAVSTVGQFLQLSNSLKLSEQFPEVPPPPCRPPCFAYQPPPSSPASPPPRLPLPPHTLLSCCPPCVPESRWTPLLL